MIYYSQPATRQDEWVIERSDSLQGGYFVEIGAHDGKRHSNTLTLEDYYGWGGLLVEGNPQLFEELVQNRPRATCVQAVVGESAGFNRFAFGGPFGGMLWYMPTDWRVEHGRRRTPFDYLMTSTLQAVLDEHDAPTVIDYLSIDVEGAEYAILKSFFPTDYRVNLITVEFRYDKFVLDQLERLLEPTHYLDQVRAFDACFVAKRAA